MVVGYSDGKVAREVLDVMRQYEPDWMLGNNVVLVERDRVGKPRVRDQKQLIPGRAVPWSALWRRLLQTARQGDRGIDSGAHAAGAVGIPATFVMAAHELIERRPSALVIWLRTPLPEHVPERLCPPGSDTLRIPLAAPQDALLHSVLDVLGPVESQTT